jgi:hypothetical protein
VKVWNPIDIGNLQEADVAITLSLLEKEFPQTFFDIMIHLLLHVNGLDVYGSVHNHWMYPMEWLMKVLKDYVHSMAQPKGSMAKGLYTTRDIGLCD